MGIIKRLVDLADETVKKEPVRVATVAAGVVVFLCAKLGLVVPKTTVLDAVEVVIPVVFGGEVARSKVTPVTPPTK